MNFTSRDYELATEYRTRQIQQAEQQGLQDQTRKRQNQSSVVLTLRQAVIFVTVILLATLLLVAAPGAQAQDSRILAEADGSVSPQIEVALIMGDFYFDNGDYAQAIAEFNKAIAEMPDQLFELMPEQALVFWQLGEAQEQAGFLEDALISYQRFLDLVDASATDSATAYVLALELSLSELNL